jgi:hypothetical protein
MRNSQRIPARRPRLTRTSPAQLASVFTMGQAIPGLNRRVSLDNIPYRHVSQFEIRAAMATTTIAETFYSLAITASAHISDYASLSGVFDQYRIDQIEIWALPRNSASATIDTGLATTVIDYDDAALLASVAAANDYGNALIGRGDFGHHRPWQPHVAIAAYSGAFTSFANVTSPWIDVASGGVQHYGFKWASSATSVVIVWDIIIKIQSSWKNDR